MDPLYYVCFMYVMLSCLLLAALWFPAQKGLIICALWSPAGKGLTSLFSFVVSNCAFVLFPLVSWVGCDT